MANPLSEAITAEAERAIAAVIEKVACTLKARRASGMSFRQELPIDATLMLIVSELRANAAERSKPTVLPPPLINEQSFGAANVQHTTSSQPPAPSAQGNQSTLAAALNHPRSRINDPTPSAPTRSEGKPPTNPTAGAANPLPPPLPKR